MDFITPLISVVASLFNSITAKISYVVSLDQRADSLTIALKELKDTRDDLQRKIKQAELEGNMCTNQVRGWLERVEAIETEVDSCLDDLKQGNQCLGCCNANCSSRYKLSEKISVQSRDISELKMKGDSIVVVDGGSLPPAVEEIPNRSTVGLNVMLEKVQQILGEDEVGIIGIYGMGGVGKTTLLKSVNNEFLVKTHDFDVVIWVLVSKDIVTEKIQQAIGARLGLLWEETESQGQRTSKIFRIMRRKRFLLLLDDVWEGLDFEKIGIPLPNKTNKCKVIFTTRSMTVCSDMDAQRKLRLEFLKENESWQLFSEKIGGIEILDSPSIRPHAETIIRKCGGLPLALITMGRAMANKETEEEWKYAIEVLNKSPSELRGMEDVFTLLKFSYDSLENDTLRACFLYCSLFPEDYSISNEQLVEYWVGEGFLDSSYDGNVYYKGHSLIGSLKIACLLESGEEKSTQVKMHDVVRSFALWVASDCGTNEKLFLVQASTGLIEAPRIEKWEGAMSISLLDNGITELSETPICPHLSTLLLQSNNGLNKITNGFFEYMPILRVLDLSFTSIREIPESISSLIELRHLDLSSTKITSLPKGLGGLQELRHLNLQRTHSLTTIPREAIFELSQLRVLNFYYSYGGWEVQDSQNEVKFADLESLKHLAAIGITVTELTTLRRLSGYSTLLKCIQYLYIKECEGLYHLQLSSKSGDGERLRRLSINNCYNLKYLLIGAEAGKNWLPSLELLALHGLPNLIKVWRNPVTRECLRSLQSISIWHCHKLKNVSWISKLPKLEVIYLFYCKEMEEVVSGDVVIERDSMAFFPSLRTISIRELPELQSISQCALDFPSLKRIAVMNCPKLKKLPLKAHNGLNLPTVYGRKEWWDGLEWDDDATKSAFLPHFLAT